MYRPERLYSSSGWRQHNPAIQGQQRQEAQGGGQDGHDIHRHSHGVFGHQLSKDFSQFPRSVDHPQCQRLYFSWAEVRLQVFIDHKLHLIINWLVSVQKL